MNRTDLNAAPMYVPPSKQGIDLKLDANEWPVDDDFNRYPEPQPQALIETLAQIYAVDDRELLISRGSDEAIDLIIRSVLQPGNGALVQCSPAFEMYRHYATLHGIRTINCPLKRCDGFAVDIPAIVSATEQSGASIVFLCSPNNPTGSTISEDQIVQLLEAVSSDVLVVLDEAYVEFSVLPSLARRAVKSPNLIVLRTLSKAYGLAGLRLGVAIGAVASIARIRAALPPYPIPSPVVDAALRALCIPNLIELRVQQVRRAREQMQQTLKQLSYVHTVWPSDANFLLLEVSDADRLVAKARTAGVSLRRVTEYADLSNAVRITIGTQQQNERLLKLLIELQSVLPGQRAMAGNH